MIRQFRSLLVSIGVVSMFLTSIAIADDDGLKVGVSAPLTGDLAEYGSAVRSGIVFATEEAPENFTRIKFAFEDNQYESAKALSAFNKLRTIDKVNLIYNWGEPPLHAIAPVAEKAQFPVVAMSLDPEPSVGKKYILRSINYSEQYAQKLVEFLRAQGFKKIAVLKTEDHFLNSMVDALRKHLKSDESLVVFATFTPDEHDFKTQIAKLKRANFDVLGVYLFTGQVSAFYRQAVAQQMEVPTFGTDFFESKNEIQQASGGMNGAVYPNIDVPSKFHEGYQKRFGNDAQIAYAYNAYEFAKLTGQLFNSVSKSLSAEQILDSYLHPPSDVSFSVRETALGGRFYEFPLVIKKIVNGEIVKVD